MKEVSIYGQGKKYRVYIDNTMDKLNVIFEENKVKIHGKIFLITDDIVYGLYKNIIENLQSQFKCKVYYFQYGEANKNMSTVQEIYDFLVDNEAGKDSILIALGGGIVGDLVGFVASTYMNGIKFINIPTTLVAQTDSCIGRKVRYNHKKMRNVIGNFYDPSFVYVCIGFLKTLNNRQFRDGLVEAIKYGIIRAEDLLEFIEKNQKYILERENDKLLHIIRECLKIRSEIIQYNCEDSSIESIISFGDLIGNAIEIDSDFRMSYGESAALGILASIKLSEIKLLLSGEVYKRVKNLLSKLELPIKYKVDNYSSFMYAINHDKKNNNKIKLTLLREIGDCEIKVEVSEEEILLALRESIFRG
jgi:3-dehydroquinate synthase